MKINGQILDSQKAPLALANVTILTGEKAGKLGAVADYDGIFSLDSDLISADSKFQISYVGFLPKTLRASELQNATIILSESVEQLAGVTVYGKPKTILPVNSRAEFTQHLQKHKFVYAALGLVLGIVLIATSIKK